MEDLAVLAHFKDVPGSIILFYLVVFIKIIEIIAAAVKKFVVPVFSKKKSIEQILAEDKDERINRQEYVDSEFASLKANDDRTWEVLLKVSEDNQYNLFLNEKADIVERFKAYRMLIALERNGDIRSNGFKLILQHSKDSIDPWRQAEKYKLPIQIKNQKYWDEVMSEINRRIYDGFGGVT